MKIRTGFVSNSSSSSFVIVGIQNKTAQKIFDKVLANQTEIDTTEEYWTDILMETRDPLLGSDDDGFGQIYLGDLTFIASEDYDNSIEVYYVGVNAMPFFEQDKKLSQIKKMFIEKCEKHGFIIPENQVKLIKGVGCSG